jgi:hypothetical protein
MNVLLAVDSLHCLLRIVASLILFAGGESVVPYADAQGSPCIDPTTSDTYTVKSRPISYM